MPDYTVEVRTSGSVDYSFDVLDIQPFIRAKPQESITIIYPEDYDPDGPLWPQVDVIDHPYDEWHWTEVPVYDPPDADQFHTEMSHRFDDGREIRIRDASNNIFVEGPVEVVNHQVGIGDELITEGLFRLQFDTIVSGLPDRPPYRKPGGLYERITENADQYWNADQY